MSRESDPSPEQASTLVYLRVPPPPPGADAGGPRADDPTADLPPPGLRGAWSLRHPVLYPWVYIWFVFLAALDIICTWKIISLGGSEANWLADLVIRHGGVVGTSAYKFGLTVVIILVCEYVGRRRYTTGRRLAKTAVLITCIPVVVALVQMIAVLRHGTEPH
ncbi:MAG: hypothetical protein HRU75_02525 [Planctomycetia bacterium]|nr:MAG: hypothetical protein HRU75_02525 [Planctomycetia bacterium]